MRFRQLADPWQDNRIDETDAQAGHHAAADVHVGVLAACLKSCAEDAKPGAGQDCLFAPKFVTSPA